MSAFEILLISCAVIIFLALLAGIVLILKTREALTRAVLADLVFYAMLALYFMWSLNNQTSIVYDVMILAALAAGVLPTISMSRIISRGRR
ncbi:hypothetical protein [Corynebacterium caspium]|uniref:hypothetical protein n=1 Tax=Corynebacterium caspium TaxID=234828 RepID=UPI00037F90CF|nr:hypothetical protein [Corynebacterium caspium]WKD58551.1 putative monovalent cation/H+ antiporter subunit F [Corynebacterium caspium DSM 44850]